jgi:hypothetical protein
MIKRAKQVTKRTVPADHAGDVTALLERRRQRRRALPPTDYQETRHVPIL